MSYVVVPKAAVDILPCSTFYSLLEEQFIERVHFDVLTFVCRKSPGRAVAALSHFFNISIILDKIKAIYLFLFFFF